MPGEYRQWCPLSQQEIRGFVDFSVLLSYPSAMARSEDLRALLKAEMAKVIGNPTALARKSGISKQYLYAIMAGHRRPSSKLVDLWADLLSVPRKRLQEAVAVSLRKGGVYEDVEV